MAVTCLSLFYIVFVQSGRNFNGGLPTIGNCAVFIMMGDYYKNWMPASFFDHVRSEFGYERSSCFIRELFHYTPTIQYFSYPNKMNVFEVYWNPPVHLCTKNLEIFSPTPTVLLLFY